MAMIYIIESPFAASAERTQEEHRIHALKLCRAVALAHPGAVVFASHAYIPLFLFESDARERGMGIEMQISMRQLALRATHTDYGDVYEGKILVWDDWGISNGMAKGLRGTPAFYHTRGEVPEWNDLDTITLP
jgi:hypothetical protein